MRLVRIVAALVLSFAAAGAASAQDEVVRELQRKARATEKDAGFCARVAEGLPRLDQAHVRARINEMLSRADGEGATLLFATGDPAPTPQMCFYFVFQPAAMKGGKKCRESAIFGCVAGRECRLKADQPICEVRPGTWD